MEDELMNFDLPENRSSIIKVVGIGGGGSNAVNHMWKQGIKDVNFIVCNTDAQALNNSPVPVRVQIGGLLTEGRGAGNKPQVGRQAAIENLDDIMKAISTNTKMVFLTAGMGGGTGTGAAPVIAKATKDRGILTVAIVTIPFRFEGQQRIHQAIEGINELKEHVDSLLVINNEKLREIYGDLKLSEAFTRADNVLSIAAKGIAEIITVHGYINVDFADVETVMKDSGVAILGSGSAAGEKRAVKAIQDALSSPLLNNNDITGAKNILLNITSGTDEISMDEVGEITDYVNQSAAKNALVIWGTGSDNRLAEHVSVTIIATGFATNSIPELYIRKRQTQKLKLEDKKQVSEEPPVAEPDTPPPAEKIIYSNVQRTIEFDLSGNNYGNEPELFSSVKKDQERSAADMKKLEERMEKLRKAHDKLKEHKSNQEDEKISIEHLENEPAYVRKKLQLENRQPSSETKISKFSLSGDEDEGGPKLREDNSYLHDNVD